MENKHSSQFVTSAIALALVLFAEANVSAQVANLTPPSQPQIELLNEVEATIILEESGNASAGNDIDSGNANISKQQMLLSSSDLVGFGAATTGGANEIVVRSIEEFVAAVSQSDSYVRLDPSLTGKTLYISDTIDIDAANITIDGSDAPGAIFKPSESFQGGGVMMYSRGPNFIINNITLEANYYPDGSSNNVGGIRFSNDGIWVNKVTVSGLWDDAFDMVYGATNATFSKVKTFNTDKTMNMFYPHDPDKRVSIHSSDLAGRQRNPWNQGAAYVHMWNNYIHDAQWAGQMAGLSASQYSRNSRTSPGPAHIISEHNVFEDTGSDALRAYAESAGLEGYIHSNGDDLGGGRVQGAENVLYTDNPSLFYIPYTYNPLPTDEVKAYVLATAGAF